LLQKIFANWKFKKKSSHIKFLDIVIDNIGLKLKEGKREIRFFINAVFGMKDA
jgi:hypothetical protein